MIPHDSAENPLKSARLKNMIHVGLFLIQWENVKCLIMYIIFPVESPDSGLPFMFLLFFSRGQVWALMLLKPHHLILTTTHTFYRGTICREWRRVSCCAPVAQVLVHYDSPKHMDESPFAWCKCETQPMRAMANGCVIMRRGGEMDMPFL